MKKKKEKKNNVKIHTEELVSPCSSSTLLRLQSCCGDKPVKFYVVFPDNGTAVLSGSTPSGPQSGFGDKTLGIRLLIFFPRRGLQLCFIKPFFLPVNIQHNQCQLLAYRYKLITPSGRHAVQVKGTNHSNSR